MVDRSQYATECVQPLNQDVFYPCTPTTGPMLHGGNRQYTSHSSFRSFFSAMALLFQCATGQDWKFVMYALEGPDGAKTGIFIYFSSFFFLSNYILANLFIAVILDNFSACLREVSPPCCRGRGRRNASGSSLLCRCPRETLPSAAAVRRRSSRSPRATY